MIRVFPRRTKWTPDGPDVYIGSPPEHFTCNEQVYISVTFTDDLDKALYLRAEWSALTPRAVLIGGPALADPGLEFVPGRFLKHGITITSRGCPNRCGWCHVPEREGSIRELSISRGHIVQDNNLFACSPEHIEAVFAMLRTVDQPVKFSGGVDAARFTADHRALIDTIRLGELWFACDAASRLSALQKVVPLLKGIPRSKRRCYVMVGFENETISKADERVRKVYRLGFDPFVQFYSGPGEQKHTAEWKSFCRTWSRPAAYRTLMKETVSKAKHEAT